MPAFLVVALAQGVEAATLGAENIRIPNFGTINQNYFRGAQPDRAGFESLKSLGVKTIIDLQADARREEPEWVQSAGMRYINIPLSSMRPATAAQTARFLEVANDSTNWPVYVHCAGGRHRTGEMTAIYRITRDSWTADKAYEEMKRYDYYSFPFHGSLRTYVYQYYDEYQRSRLQAKARPDSSATQTAVLSNAAAVTR